MPERHCLLPSFGLTIPISPRVLAAVRAERERRSRDVQVLDQMTEPVHDPIRNLPALPQKLVQRHECRSLVSHTQTNSVIQREPSLHLQSPAAHCNRLQIAASKCRHGKDLLCCNVAGHSESRQHALTCILWGDVCISCIQDKPGVRCRATLGIGENSTVQSWQKPQKKKKKAESLSAQPPKQILEVRMAPVLHCTNTCSHLHTLSQVQLLTAQCSTGFHGRMRGEEGEGEREQRAAGRAQIPFCSSG